MTAVGQDAFEVTVSAEDLSALILAVHDAASVRPTARQRKWTYGNVIAIAGAKVRDLSVEVARVRHGSDKNPIAAVEVTQRRLAVDVLFDVHADTATAHFALAGEVSQGHDLHEETAWASFLASSTADTLAAAGVRVHLQPGLQS